MRKAFLYIIVAIALATSCSVDVMESTDMGSISLALYSDVEVVADTKADAAFDCSDFLIDIYGTTYYDGRNYASKQYVYGSMPDTVRIPFGYYRVSAQNCTEVQAEEGFGEVRYFGESRQVDVLSYSLVPVTVACKMANGKASMTFDGSFLEDFDDITVDFSLGSRTVTLTSEQANASTQVYFNVPEEGADLVFRVEAKVAKGTEQERTLHYSNEATPARLAPGKWAKFTLKSNHNGIIGGPDINVDEEMDTDHRTEIINPDEGKESGEMSTITVTVDTQIDEATVVDCVLDVY